MVVEVNIFEDVYGSWKRPAGRFQWSGSRQFHPLVLGVSVRLQGVAEKNQPVPSEDGVVKTPKRIHSEHHWIAEWLGLAAS